MSLSLERNRSVGGKETRFLRLPAIWLSGDDSSLKYWLSSVKKRVSDPINQAI
jgi:hypothetical protein